MLGLGVRWCGPSKRPEERQDEFISSVLLRFELVQRGVKTLPALVRRRYQGESDGEPDRKTEPDHK